jgi:hypothetical protein
MPKTGVPLESLDRGRLKGGIFRSHLQWVRDHRTPDDFTKLIERLSPDMRKALGATILVSSWFPFAWLIELDRTIASMFGGEELYRELGRYSATINLSTTYKLLDRKANQEFFRNSALIHGQFQDFGTVTYTQTAESACRMVHASKDARSPVFCLSAVGYYQGCVESHGGRAASVVEVECQCFGDSSCTFDISWQ